jgi:hypothetical protein
MNDACEAVALPWLLKKAVLVLNTLEVRCSSPGPPAAVCGGGDAQPPALSPVVQQQRQSSVISRIQIASCMVTRPA